MHRRPILLSAASGAIGLLLLAGCLPQTETPSTAPSESISDAPEATPISAEVIAYASGEWSCRLVLGGAELPFPFDFRIDPEAGEFAFDIGGSGMWFTYAIETDGGSIASTGEDGQEGVAAGSALSGFPTELPADGETVTMTFDLQDGSAPRELVVVRTGDTFTVQTPGIADADEMRCGKA